MTSSNLQVNLVQNQNGLNVAPSSTERFVKNEVKGLFQRYTGSYLFYRAPEAISFVGSAIVNTISATATLASSLLFNTENHIKYVAPIPLRGVQDSCPAVPFSFGAPKCALVEAPLPKPLFPDAHTCGVFSALTLPVSQTISYTSRKVLGCDQNTPIRNAISGIVTFAATPTTTAFIANNLGYEVEPKAMFDQQVQGVYFLAKLAFVGMGVNVGMAAYNKCYEKIAKKFEDIEDPTLKDIATSISSAVTVGGVSLTTTLGLGYALGYSNADISGAALSLAKTIVPILGLTYLTKQAEALVKEASDTAFDLIDQEKGAEVKQQEPQG